MLAAIALALALVPPVTQGAQTPVDFNGTWTEDVKARKVTPRPTGAPAGQLVVEGPPPPQIVVQTAQSVRIDRPWQHGVVRYVFRLDGAESRNRNGANTLTTRSRWDNGRLITEGTSYSETSAGESTWKFKEIRWIDATGAMVVETSNIDEAGKLQHVVQVFRKK